MSERQVQKDNKRKQKRKEKKVVSQELNKAVGKMTRLAVSGSTKTSDGSYGPSSGLKVPRSLLQNKLSSLRGAKDLTGCLNALRMMGCTPEGALWLMQSLNPFSDWKADAVGFPDTDGSRSVVYRVPLQMAVNAGSNGAIGNGQFDVNFFFLPTLTSGASDSLSNFDYNQTNGILSQSASGAWPTFNFGFLNAVVVPSGTATGPVGGSSLANMANATVLTLGLDTYIKGNGRVVSWGLEVYNNTPVLSIGGAVTVYRQPQSHSYASSLTIGNPAGGPVVLDFGTQYSRIMNLWPTTSADALVLSQSKQWNASDGAYVIGTASASENPYTQKACQKVVYVQNNGATLANTTALAQNPLTITPIGGGTAYNLYTANFLGPVDTNGAYFFNLPNATVLTAVLTAFVEVAPVAKDQTAPLAKECCPFDPLAIELMARVTQTMSVGDMVKNNANGDWFRKICNILADVAEPIGQAIGCFVPGASMVGSTIAKGARFGAQLKLS